MFYEGGGCGTREKERVGGPGPPLLVALAELGPLLKFASSVRSLARSSSLHLAQPTLSNMTTESTRFNPSAYLKGLGWKGPGAGLNDSPHARARPVIAAQKKSLSGVGKDRDTAFPWWEIVFANVATKVGSGDKVRSEKSSEQFAVFLPELTRDCCIVSDTHTGKRSRSNKNWHHLSFTTETERERLRTSSWNFGRSGRNQP